MLRPYCPYPSQHLNQRTPTPSSDVGAPARSERLWITALALMAILLYACQVTPTPTLVPIPTATYIPTEEATPTIELKPTNTPSPIRAVVTDTLRVRESPSTDARIIARLMAGSIVYLLARKDDNQWYEIEYPPDSGNVAWIAAGIVETDFPTDQLPIGFTSPAPPPGAIFARTTDILRVRSGPGTDYDVIGRLPNGARVTLLARSEDGEWYQINYPPDSGKRAWIKGEFLQLEGAPDQMPVAARPPTPTPAPTPIPRPSRAPITPAPPRNGTPGPVGTGQILTTSNRDGAYDIYNLAENGAARARLSHLGDSFGARFSPNGARIVFYRIVSTSPVIASHILVMNSDGSGQLDLSRGAAGASDSDPDWSPDGNRIAFVRTARAGAPEIWQMNVDGSNARRIVTLSSTTTPPGASVGDSSPQPRWSPDGGRLAYAAVPRTHNPGAPLYPSIFTINANGSNETQLTDNDLINSNPVWSPDGKTIVWSAKDFINRQNWRVWTMSASGGNQRVLIASFLGDANNGVQAVEWIGNRMLLAGWTGNWNAYLANADGSNITPVTSDSIDNKPTDWLP